MKYEYWMSPQNNLWYWHLKAANGEIVAQGEGYSSRQHCLHGINLVKQSMAAEVKEKAG